jgi:hypothetical protein
MLFPKARCQISNTINNMQFLSLINLLHFVQYNFYNLFSNTSYKIKFSTLLLHYNISVHFYLFQKNYLNERFDDVNIVNFMIND